MNQYEAETQVYKCIWRCLAVAAVAISFTIGGCTTLELSSQSELQRQQIAVNPNAVANAEARKTLHREIDNENIRFYKLWDNAQPAEFEGLVKVRQMQLLDRAIRYRIYIKEYQLRNSPGPDGIQLSLPNKAEDIEKELKQLRQGIESLTAKKE